MLKHQVVIETFELTLQVLDKDIGQDKSLGIVKYPLLELEPEKSKEVNLKLLPSLDTNKIKDKKDRGTITIKVSAAPFFSFSAC